MNANALMMDAFFTVLLQPWNLAGMQKFSSFAFGIKTGFIPDFGSVSLPVREQPGQAERNLLLQWGQLKPDNQFPVPFEHECKLVFILNHYDPEEFQDVSVSGFWYTGVWRENRVIYYAIGW